MHLPRVMVCTCVVWWFVHWWCGATCCGVRTCPREQAAVVASAPQLAGTVCQRAQQRLHACPVVASGSDGIATGAPDLHLGATAAASAPDRYGTVMAGTAPLAAVAHAAAAAAAAAQPLAQQAGLHALHEM